ncbi:carnitine transporter [Polyrhizophydium stewartii]|uniref:Carnitine transporter n=1 Tax=Polyrhizophydium stewartii TaxID=2732419 RepID=A0ABR4NG77_9FUNG|nr:carnitine transporter [Polyrhizophydium stewartii]
MGEQAPRPKSALKSFLAGAFGGLTLVAVSHPFDLVKVRMQTGVTGTARISTLQAARRIVAADGFLGLYRGVTPVFLGTPPVLATNFWAYFVCQQLVIGLSGSGRGPAAAKDTGAIVDQLSLNQIGLAGALAAIPVSFLLGPAEQVKIRLQVQQTAMRAHGGSAGGPAPQGFVEVIRQIVREGGVRAVFRGTGFTILRDFPGSYFYFLTYEGLKRWFRERQGHDGHVNSAAIMLSGGIAGMINWTIAIPMDTIKSRLQSAPPGEASVGKVVSKLFAESGPAGLFRGLGPTLLRAFPASAAFFFGVETSSRIMDQFF